MKKLISQPTPRPAETSELSQNLDNYYRRQGISATNFACPMATSCQSVCTDFIAAREAFVGSDYEKGTLPRLLFLSLDPARDLSGRNEENRTTQFMRDWEENRCDPASLPKGSHWRQTHQCAHDILERVSVNRGHGSLKFRDIHRFFAHTNSAKCKDAARGTAQGRTLLFKNCRRFIPGEVAALRPDVIVTQGALARDAIENAFPLIRTGTCPTNEMYKYQVVSVNQRPVLKLSMAHPKARGGTYQKEMRDAYAWYVDRAQHFMMNGLAGL